MEIVSIMMETDGSGFNKKKRTMSCLSSDIISNLPCNVLEKILLCLTVQDVSRTSVLSRKWRYIWTTLPQLVFDDSFCRGSVMRATTNKLMMSIYKVLLLHRGPILKFNLTLRKLKSCPEIDQLICFLLNNGIREFTLQMQKGEPYKLPSALFSCLRLEHLKLSSCVFKPHPRFKVFTGLLSLELHKVFIAGDVLSSLTSSCPLLEQLTIRCCTSFDYLEIVAPKLKRLWCEGLYRAICFRIPSEIVDFLEGMEGSRNQLGFNGGETCNSAKVLGGLPAILVLGYQSITM